MTHTLQLTIATHSDGTRTVGLRRPEMVAGKTWDAGMKPAPGATIGDAIDAIIQEHFREVLA